MSKELFFETRQQELAELVEQVEQGNRSALATYAELKKTAQEYANAISQVESIAMTEAETYGSKSFQAYGHSFEIRNGAKRFDYSGISEWQTYKKALSDCESRYKAAFEAKQKGILIASGDGEELEMPEINYSKDSLVLKK